MSTIWEVCQALLPVPELRDLLAVDEGDVRVVAVDPQLRARQAGRVGDRERCGGGRSCRPGCWWTRRRRSRSSSRPASDGGGVPGGPVVEAAASVVLTAAVPTEVIVLVSSPIVSLPPAVMPATLLTLTLVSPGRRRERERRARRRGADRGDRARLEPVAAVAGVDVDRAADVVAGDAGDLDVGVARGRRRGQRAAPDGGAVPPRERVRPPDRRVGHLDVVGRALAELDADRVRAAAQLVS